MAIYWPQLTNAHCSYIANALSIVGFLCKVIYTNITLMAFVDVTFIKETVFYTERLEEVILNLLYITKTKARKIVIFLGFSSSM